MCHVIHLSRCGGTGQLDSQQTPTQISVTMTILRTRCGKPNRRTVSHHSVSVDVDECLPVTKGDHSIVPCLEVTRD